MDNSSMKRINQAATIYQKRLDLNIVYDSNQLLSGSLFSSFVIKQDKEKRPNERKSSSNLSPQ